MRLSRARAARAEKSAALDPSATAPDPPVAPLGPPAPAPELIKKFAKETHDLDAIRKSVEDAASVSAGLWLSFLFALFYIGIAAGAVTHKDLLFENPVKLPFFGVDLPLIAFFVLAPILFIVFHAYTLVHFVILGAKAWCFNEELINQLPGAPETWDGLRRQLPNNIFVQFLAGPGDIREGKLGLILMAIAWISLAIGPVLLLLLIQAQFLPYHLARVTWVHRFAVLADVILLWLLWPAALYGRSKPMWRLEGRGKGWPGVLALTGRYVVGLTACLVPVGLAFTAATFPGERMEDWIGNKQWIPPNGVIAWLGAEDPPDEPRWTSFHDLLFNGKVDGVTLRRKSLFSNTLVLPGFDALQAAHIDDPKKLDSVEYTLSLLRRHFESAVFAGANLRKVDMTGAQLQGASLDSAQLQGAQLWQAQLQHASLGFAQLQRASLKGAQLQGASLNRARLQGASLENAQLQGASLKGAQLQGASLKGAELQGASLLAAQLQGASLLAAQLQGASLLAAQLQGASLKYARLQGASLHSAQLQGAHFQKSTLAGTDMGGAAVWRTNFELISAVAVFEDDLKESAMSNEEFATLKVTIVKEVPEGEQREQAVKRIEILNPDIFGPEATLSETLEEGHVNEAAYKASLADQLKSLACSEDDDALHIVRGLVMNGPIKNTGAQATGLVEAILKPDCPVSAALTEQDKADLRKLAEERQPIESKQ
ncbi:MAG: pentapeptide repeat-containing protein [Pseudomonadota bacterium]|nr:pentapeptide repeat-containing protein [Pseudomonadota bacterium]